ncbi:MAG: ABC transporter ATP-binding protein [Campylobacterota bacterium]|nr:ABC transporter ATP-binding protein [Campylobacterota bacterium]
MIILENVNKTYNESRPNAFHALKDISLHVREGELLILKGISGSGKSTLLSIIGSLIKPSSGSVRVDNDSIAKLPDLHASTFRAQKLGFIFQSFNLFEGLSIADNVALPLINQSLSQKSLHVKIQNAMKTAHIDHKASQEVRLLSGGEKQRCAIARALVNDPKVILCDEPTANLDSINSQKFITTLKELNQLGKTIVVATHDPIFESMDARIITIENGMIKPS